MVYPQRRQRYQAERAPTVCDIPQHLSGRSIPCVRYTERVSAGLGLASTHCSAGFNHNNPQSSGASSLAISPDSKPLVTGGGNGSLYLWDIATGHVLDMFEGHSDHKIGSVSFSGDRKRVVSGGTGKSRGVWDVGRKRTYVRQKEEGVLPMLSGLDGWCLPEQGQTHVCFPVENMPDAANISTSLPPWPPESTFPMFDSALNGLNVTLQQVDLSCNFNFVTYPWL
jgi:WD40 repeat protein